MLSLLSLYAYSRWCWTKLPTIRSGLTRVLMLSATEAKIKETILSTIVTREIRLNMRTGWSHAAIELDYSQFH